MLLLVVALAAAAPPGPVVATLDTAEQPGAIDGVPAGIAQAIWQIELLRLAPVTLSSFVAHEDARVRARAADALGRLRAGDSAIPLATLLEDPDRDVRERAAFALGQTPGGDVPLGRRWTVESDTGVRARMAVALGKQGGAAAIDMLLPALAGPVSTAAADGLGRLGMRKIPGAADDRVVAALLDATLFPPVGETRRRVAWALSRMGLTATGPDNAMRLRRLALEDGDALVRAWALRAWSGVAVDAARLDGLTLAARDPAVGVRIAAARGAARHPGPGLTPLLSILLADPDLAVRLEAIAATGDARAVDARTLLNRAFGSSIAVERAAALRALAKQKVLPADAGTYSEAPEPLAVRVAAIEVMEDRNRLLFLAVHAAEPTVRSAAAGVVLGSDAPRSAELVSLLQGADVTIAAAAAAALAEHPDPGTEPALLAYLRREGLAAELAVEGVKALKVLYDTGRLPRPGPTAASAIRPWLRHPAIEADAERLAALLGVAPPVRRHPARRLPPMSDVMHIRSARVFTSQGEIRITLDPAAAPYTVWNFARLAEDGYYDGLPFHRVVPDFVIQTGCPRGDGWGGPGYEIPDEINPLPYVEGTVGMALSGPDTGGSQWFVTLSPQPHLDGGYTVFGRVSYGMRSAASVQVGDTIERIVIERVP